jgi:hypothetical protein
MPSNSELSKNDRNRAPTEHATVTSKDVPGTGGARRAAEAKETRRDRNRSALEAAQRAINPKRKR